MSKFFKVNVSVIICDGDKVLIQQRSKNEEVFPGMWGIPGGTVEMGDASLDQALEREIHEEVGDVHIKNISLVSTNIKKKEMYGVLYLVYVADFVEGNPIALDGTDAVAWVTRDSLGQYEFTPTTRELIENTYERENT